MRDMLLCLGYHEMNINAILDELETLFREIDFNRWAMDDKTRLISSLKDMMLLLENKGYYRPDAPTRLIKLLVNGLNLSNEDIFVVLDKASIPDEEKRQEQELLASCAAITQLGYILLSNLFSEVKAASSGPHVFILLDVQDSTIFVDFSIGSIQEIDMQRYDRKENYYYLKNPDGLDNETSKLLTEYYSFFHVTGRTGLSHNIHNNLGITYDRIGRYEEAIDELKEALRLDPGYIEVHNNLAVTYDKMNRFEEAIAELEEALRLNPAYIEAHSNLGNIYARAGMYEEAIKELHEALRLNPGYAVAHNNLGNIYALQEKKHKACKEFEEALHLNPDYACARNNLGSVYADMGMYKEALKEFEEALRIDPGLSEAYRGIGSVYYSIGSYERSINSWVRAVYLDPELLEAVPEKLILKVRQGVSRLK